MGYKMPLKSWFSLFGLTCSAFIFNTSEFIPMGLLTDIAADFVTTEARAGIIISVYAWVVTLLSLPLMILASRFELRKLILATLCVFVLFQLLSSISANYSMLMFSRIGVACAHSIFWSIVSPIAVRIVPPNCQPLALSMIVTGTSIAMIFGLPLGRFIGLQVGWRMTFLCIGLFALVLLGYLTYLLPKVPSRGQFTFRQVPSLFQNRLLLGIYLLTFAMAAATYTAYSYIEPFLKQIAQMPDTYITFTLMTFGAMGILGSIAFSKLYPLEPCRFISIAILGIASCILLLKPSTTLAGSLLIILPCSLWGICFTAFNISLQAEIINYSPQNATAVSMSIYSGIFNLGIGIGTSLGGIVCTWLTIADIGYAGGLTALAAFFFWYKKVYPLKKAMQ